MGHEIAHAVAKHSVERMSAAMAVNVTTQIADIFTGGKISQTRNTVGRATGMDVFQLGIMNPFGRKQESEADYLGLIFSSLSGYNIKESTELWKRMKRLTRVKEPPQFLSTHPSSDNRIEKSIQNDTQDYIRLSTNKDLMFVGEPCWIRTNDTFLVRSALPAELTAR